MFCCCVRSSVRNIIGIEYESISMCGELVGDFGDGFSELASFSVLGK